MQQRLIFDGILSAKNGAGDGRAVSLEEQRALTCFGLVHGVYVMGASWSRPLVRMSHTWRPVAFAGWLCR